MDELLNRFSTLEQSAEIERSYQHINDPGKSNLQTILPDPLSNSQLFTKLGTSLDLPALRKTIRESKPRFPPPEVLPCANVEVEKYKACPNPGKMASVHVGWYHVAPRHVFPRSNRYLKISFSPRNVNWRTGALIKSGMFLLQVIYYSGTLKSTARLQESSGIEGLVTRLGRRGSKSSFHQS